MEGPSKYEDYTISLGRQPPENSQVEGANHTDNQDFEGKRRQDRGRGTRKEAEHLKKRGSKPVLQASGIHEKMGFGPIS